MRLHGIDAPELDQTFWWRSQQLVCGTISFAALEALIAGVKVRCEVVERDRLGRQGLSSNGVDIGRRLVSSGWSTGGYSTDYVAAEDEADKARDVAGHLREALGVPRIVTAPTGIHALRSGRDATAAGRIVIVQTFARRGRAGRRSLRYPVGQMASTTSRPG